jgi:surfactin synthase thioesterase subunit
MTNPAARAEWERYTSKLLSIEGLDGQHYFILDQPEQVALCVDGFSKRVDSRLTIANADRL